MTRTDLIGVSEIAALAGISNAAVSNWMRRHPTFPAPAVEVPPGSGRKQPLRLWEKDAIETWIADRAATERQRLLTKLEVLDAEREEIQRQLEGLDE